MKENFDVLVIGGGAAGMMAAGRAAERGKRVLLLERNKRLGEKLRITGGGRCNITNTEPSERKLLAHYGDAEPLLYSLFSEFGVNSTRTFFEARGLSLKVEANHRAFPESEKALDVVRVLERYLEEGKVVLRTGTTVERIETSAGRISSVLAGGKEYQATSYILATGGLSHPETGSTGDGFTWLRSLKHRVEKPTPTIVPLRIRESWVKRLSGKKMTDAKITFFVPGGKKFSKTGTLLFTHFGLSGPTILNAAGQVADLMQEGQVEARIDVYPGMDLGILDRHITSVFDQTKNKLLRNVFKELVPPGMGDILISLIPGIDSEKKVHSVTKEERRLIASLLKALPLTVDGLMGFERAVVADGGLLMSEIDVRTLRSRKYDNLYIVGDLLHITRPSGGYSLQLCWTTGYVAGNTV